ncbi:MAG: DUF2488 family protein [Pedobacter sp.]|nr:MAG: DUF2488 family protein [Pedobacter sp.]
MLIFLESLFKMVFMPTYYYFVMSQQEMLESSIVEEILRERSAAYIARLKPQDFWVSISPSFLSFFQKKITKSRFFFEKKDLLISGDQLFTSVLFTTNKDFFNWFKLRYGDFENIQAINPNRQVKSDGFYGKTNSESIPILDDTWKSRNDVLHPDLYLKRYNKLLPFLD